MYDSSGNLTYEYNPGTTYSAPIMGTAVAYSTRPMVRWWYGPSDINATAYQDDMAVIAGTSPSLFTGMETGIGYRPAPRAMKSCPGPWFLLIPDLLRI